MKRALAKFVLAAVSTGFSVAKRIPFLREAMNRYEAAFQNWGERSWLFQSLQDSWLEIDAMSRMELQRVAESLIENSPIVQKIRCLKIQFSVGPAGLKIIPESSDEGFNDARSVAWENWWARPELGSDISGAQLTRVWAGLLFDKGEVFVLKTMAQVPAKAGGRLRQEPRLQTIDAHRVKTPPGMSRDEKTKFPIVDGIVVNPDTGERMAYFVKRANFAVFSNGNFQSQTTEDEYDRIPAAQIIHKFKVRRPGQMRGIPEGFAAFNQVRDLMDLQKMEMQCAKMAAQIGPVETNPSGELSTYVNRKQLLNVQTQNAAGQAVTKKAFADYNVTVGGQRIALKTGSKLEDFQWKRPTTVQQEYWDLLVTMICIAYNTPKLLVMPYSLQGTVTRADLDICANAFREDFELIREICEDVYAWQGKWTLDFDTNFTGAKWQDRAKATHSVHSGHWRPKEILKHCSNSPWVMDAKPPVDPHICLIRPPRAPNVDIGYTAKALEIEMRLGIKVPQDVFADKGLDWRTQTRQMAEYIDYINQLAKEFGLQPGQITSLATQQAIEDPTNKPDPPENPEPGGGEPSPESRERRVVA